jgi:hypothetical protein
LTTGTCDIMSDSFDRMTGTGNVEVCAGEPYPAEASSRGADKEFIKHANAEWLM